MPSILAACGTGSSSGSASKLFFFNSIHLLTVRPTVCTPPTHSEGGRDLSRWMERMRVPTDASTRIATFSSKSHAKK
jgi:hypothetical protein